MKIERRISLIALFSLCICAGYAYSQKTAQPRLVGTWKLGYEDYAEFIYHKVEEFAYSYLKENPNAKMVARLCSADKMSVALAGSDSFTFPEYAQNLQVPADRIFFARWSKCEKKSEQYWFVPSADDIEFDELIAAERVRVRRLLVDVNDNPSAQPARREFAEKLKEFIAELKNNPKAEGFIISNLGMRERFLKQAWQQLRNENIDRTRLRVLIKRTYRSYYPEFIAVTISE